MSELRDIRNRWAHHEAFTTDDAYRALDTAERLLKAVAAPQAGEVERQRKEVKVDLVLVDAVKPRLRSAILGEAVRASRL